MTWRDMFNNFPSEKVEGAMVGAIEMINVLLLFAESMDKENLIDIMNKTRKSLKRDLEEIQNEKGTL